MDPPSRPPIFLLADNADVLSYALLMPCGLGIIDVMNLRCSCSTLRKSIPHLPSGFSRSRAIRELEANNVRGEEMCGMWKGSGTVIVGSFPLKIVLGESWELGDINAVNTRKFLQTIPIEKVNFPSVTRLVRKREPSAHIRAFAEFVRSARGTFSCCRQGNLGYYCTKTEGGKTYAFCYFSGRPEDWVSEEGVARKFTRKFDLEFCKLRFDGERIEADPSAWDSVLNKRSTGEGNPSEDRRKKYEDRGFRIASKKRKIRQEGDESDRNPNDRLEL